MSNKQFDFVRTENIKNYQRRLKTESDPAVREMLSRLLSEEVAGMVSSDQLGGGPGGEPRSGSDGGG